MQKNINWFLSSYERKALWSDIEKKFIPHRDNEGLPYFLGGGHWQEISHVYMSPFYVLDYALAQVCAIQFWKRSNEEWDNAWATYLHICRLGGSKSFLELLKEGELKSPFEDQILPELMKFILGWLEKME
jgi:oligoendopeptidase F